MQLYISFTFKKIKKKKKEAYNKDVFNEKGKTEFSLNTFSIKY